MLKKSLSFLLCLLLVFGSITCNFTVIAASQPGDNLVLIPGGSIVSTSSATTTTARNSSWLRNSGGSASVTTTDGIPTVYRNGKVGNPCELFTNSFSIKKNTTYMVSFEIKGSKDNQYSRTTTTTNDDGSTTSTTTTRGINFVLQDFSSTKTDGSSVWSNYMSYAEGRSDYAHTNRYSNKRSDFTCTWTAELPDGTTTSFSNTKYSSFGRKMGTSECEIASLKTLNLAEYYSDWRTFTCQFVTANSDEYNCDDFAIGFILPNDANEMYVRNVSCIEIIPDEPAPKTLPIVVTSPIDNIALTDKDLSATTTVTDNGNKTYTAKVDFDDMDGANVFAGWFNGDTFVSSDKEYTTDKNTLNSLTAKITCNSVITGALGFENYTTSTSLRVEPKQSATPPYDDRWGLWSNFTTETNGRKGYENVDWDFDIKTYYGATSVDYATGYDAASKTYSKGKTTVTPYSGDSMFCFAARSRSIVRKLDNLKPNSNYQLSFYTYNLAEWDFLQTAIIADSYDLQTNKVAGTDTVKVYNYYSEATTSSEAGLTVIADKSKIANWSKVVINFSTDSDDTYLYLHLACKNGNNSSSTSKQFVDNLTCVETIFSNLGNAIRTQSGDLPQALRYKFAISKENAEGLNGMKTNKIGILTAKTSDIASGNLIIGGQYTLGGKTVKVIDTLVDPEKNFSYVDGDESNVYFTAALYNIGKSPLGVDYTAYNNDFAVRPYIIYEAENGSQTVYYGDVVTANVFDVVYAIISKHVNDDDIATVNKLLENKELAEIYCDWQPKGGWYYGESTAKNYAYSFAVIGDVQKTTGYYPDKLHYIYDWILNNADSKNIQYVMGLGDLSEHKDPAAEWPIVTEQHYRLEQAGLNQSIVRGNHDWRFDSFITKDKFGSKLTGSYDNTMKNTYRLINIGGIKYMILTLNLFPTDNEINWAARVIAENPDYNVILTTHAYFDHDMSLTQDDDIDWVDSVEAANSGQDLYDKLVSKYSNIVMVLCGHRYPPSDGPNYRITTREDGSKVMEMMINPQRMESSGGRSYGMLAMLYFSEDGKSVQLEYFSTISGLYYMDKFQFTFELDLVD